MLSDNDIVSNTNDLLSLRATDEVSWVLRHFNIFIGPEPHLKVDPSVVIEVPKDAVMEEYAAFYGGHRLFSMGAFSCAQGRAAALVLGRYCMVAPTVQVMGETCPAGWVTVSPLIHQFGAGTGMPAFNAAQAQLMGSLNAPQEPPGWVGAPPVLGHDVWVGDNVLLARGIRIGTGAIIEAGAVVTEDVPPYSVVSGAPARVIRPRFPLELAARLLASRWWDYHPEILSRFDVRDPVAFLQGFDEAQSAGTVLLLSVRRVTWRNLLGVEDPAGFSKTTMVD